MNDFDFLFIRPTRITQVVSNSMDFGDDEVQI